MPVTNIRYAQGSPPSDDQPEALVRRGPFIPVEVSIRDELAKKLQEQEQEIPSPVSGYALIDTGATITSIDRSVAEELELAPSGEVSIGTAGGEHEVPVYTGVLSFPGTGIRDLSIERLVGVDLTGQGLGTVRHSTADDPQPGRIAALIGRDVLAHFVMVYNGPAGMITLGH